MSTKILRLNKAGLPVNWLSREETATLMVKDLIVWSLGKTLVEMRGGYTRLGKRSVLRLPTIVACDGKIHKGNFDPPLENKILFRRDKNMCLYCGEKFGIQSLSRDHVKPLSKGGKDVWTNVVTSCLRCNNRKADRNPEEANMKLLAIPFIPNQHEFLYLSNHNVLSDQMEFLSARFSGRLNLS
ncbi:MAG: HNH endonuclease [Gammaproteobacteria bacterium]|nr:HNH endonuclease [Gammaproteobacteria bacterium]